MKATTLFVKQVLEVRNSVDFCDQLLIIFYF